MVDQIPSKIQKYFETIRNKKKAPVIPMIC